MTGIGKSGLVGKKIAATLSSTGTPSYFLHPVEGMHGDLGLIRQEDVVIAISYSGKTAELLNLIPALRSLGPHIIAMTSGLNSPLAHLADLVLDIGVEREACALNIVPTSSTTATLALGDALAMCLMERKSFTSGDFYRYHPGGALGQRLSLQVDSIMHTESLPCVNEDMSLEGALAVLDARGFGAVFVTDKDNCLVGIITDGDVRRMLCRGDIDKEVEVSKIMLNKPEFATSKTTTAEILDNMESKCITILPVIDSDKKIKGIIHMHDILGRGNLRYSSENK